MTSHSFLQSRRNLSPGSTIVSTIAILLAVVSTLQAQQLESAGPNGSFESILSMPEPRPDPIPAPTPNPYITRRLNVPPPYAGKYEARIGGASEPGEDKLRLDIGASTDLLSFGEGPNRPGFVLGTDFFTWTRLRDAGGFKFPVEAVDYYFGINASHSYFGPAGVDMRLRVAHISAHLVDGDPSFSTTDARYMTYSREFVDLMIGGPSEAIGSRVMRIFPGYETTEMSRLFVRPYLGAVYMFHTLPDTLGRFTPYGGLDLSGSIVPALHARFGYELRVNNELESTVEHSLRIGLKIGEQFGPGVLLEAGYFYGRSPYGQHFSELEETTSIGFGVDF